MDDFRKKKLTLLPLEKRLMLDAALPVIANQVVWLDAADASTIKDTDGDNASTGTGGANNGFAGTVATWLDKSGNGNNVTSSVAGEQPAYGSGTLNTHGVITLDGSNDRLFNSAINVTGSAFTSFVVFNRTTAAGRDAVFEMANGTTSRNGLYVNDASAPNKQAYYINGAFVPFSTLYTPSTYTMTTIQQNGTFATTYTDAGIQSSASVSTRASTTGLYVGDDSTSGDQLQGNIAELIIYNRALTPDERHDVENYLASKWGLAETNAAPVINTDSGKTLLQGATATVNNGTLLSSDTDNTDATLIYTVTNAVDYGTLTNTHTAMTLGLGSTFTQGDIDSGYITYTHDNSTNFADAFSFTVSDQYTTPAASTYNLTITPSNHAPVIEGWTQVSSENFEGGASGWSDNLTDTSTPYLTQFLGRHSQEGGAQNTFKTYALSGTQDQAVVVFDFYEIDSWDGEAFKVYVNDTAVYSANFIQSTYNIPAAGSSSGTSWQIQELTPFNTNFAFSSSLNDQAYRFTMTVNTSAASLKLGFSSTLDQAISDEAWGVDNINIYEVKPGGAPGPMQIAENSANGTVVGAIKAIDQDVVDTLTYAITGGTGASVFAINAGTGIISVLNGAALNYEVTPSYTLTVQVSDNGTPLLSDSESFTVNVIDIPENTAPVIPAAGPFNVAENAVVNTAVGTVPAIDAEGDTLTYSITGGNAAGVFSINAATGAIKIASTTNLNYETTPSYTLTIQARDNGFGLLSASRSVTVNVTNVNEAPSFDPIQAVLNADPSVIYNAGTGNFYKYISTSVNLAAAEAASSAALLTGVGGHLLTVTSAAENAFITGIIGATVWADGSDAAVEGSWRWQSGPEAGQLFWLGGPGGSVQSGLYANWPGSQPDNAGGIENGLQIMTGGAWNDIPVTAGGAYVIEWEGAALMAPLQNGPYTIAENSSVGSVVGSAHASDPDAGDTRTFSITGGSGAGVFAINAVTGQITSTAALNYEAAASYTLNLRVQDAGGLFDTKTVTVNITDVNETPTLNPAGPFTFAENAAVGTAVTTMNGSDPDTGQTLSYAIVGGNTNGTFTINSSTGALSFAKTPDFEQTNAYSLTIRATDNGAGSLFDQKTVAIAITDVNEAPTFDPLQGVLNSDTSIIYNAATGNFYKYITSSTNLAGAEAASAAALINGQGGHLVVIDSALENSFINSLIGSAIWINGSDAAVEGQWRYTSGPKAGELFWLGAAAGSAQNGDYNSWNGGEPNDYGSGEDGVEMYTGGSWNDIDINNGLGYVIEWEGASVLPPVQNGPYAIDENSAAGTSIGFAHATDPDAGDTRTFTITGGTGAGLFALNPTTGQITLTGALDYEAASSYTLNLRVQDAGGLFDTTTVTINVNDLNEVPVLDPAGPFAFNENIAAGTAVTTLHAVDQDTAQTLTYSIQSGNTGGMFALNSATGALSFTGSPDYETQTGYHLVLRVTDNGAGALYAEQTVDIAINDLNEVPVLTPAGPFSINENVAAGTVVTTMTASDQDAGQTLTYTIQSGNTGGMFVLDAVTGVLKFSGSPNYEVVNAYNLVIRVTDNGTGALYAEQPVAITILDVNDAPSDMVLSYNHITENSAVGTQIGLFSSVDEDPADMHTYSLITNPGNKFIMVGNELRTNGPIDYEINRNFTIVTRTDDGHGGTFDKSFVIFVDDQADTFTPPPAVTPPVVVTRPVPEAPAQNRSASLIAASLDGGDIGQALAFYGMSDAHQIVRENVTFRVIDLTKGSAADAGTTVLTGFENAVQDFLKGPAVKPADDTGHHDRFTNLRQAVKFFHDMKNSDEAADIPQHQLAKPAERHLPANTINQQFVDVLTYHEQRQARLREALRNS